MPIAHKAIDTLKNAVTEEWAQEAGLLPAHAGPLSLTVENKQE